MQVKDKLQLNVFVSVLMAVVIVLILAITVYRVSHATDELQISNQIITSALERNLYREDYLRNSNDRARIQWLATHKNITDLLMSAKQKFRPAEDKKIIDELIKAQESTGKLYSAILKNHEKILSGSQTALSKQIEGRLITQLNVRLYTTVFNARRLQEAAREALSSTLNMAGWGTIFLLLIILVVVTVNTSTMGRSIVNRIKMLKEGAVVIGNGNLDYQIKMKGDDELVDLSSSFNAMTSKLRNSYSELEKEVKERKQAEKSLLESENRLKSLNENLEKIIQQRTELVHDLSKALTVAEQRERKSFSTILHENLQQVLLGAKIQLNLHLQDHKRLHAISEEDLEITDSIRLLDKGIDITRSLSLELNPPILNNQGLDAALSWLCNHMKENYGLKVELHNGENTNKIRDEAQILLVQIVRELLHNVIKHSGVMDAKLETTCGDKAIYIVVIDKGKGFNVDEVLEKTGKENKLGLFSIKERLNLFGGTMRIESASQQGTKCTITLPYNKC